VDLLEREMYTEAAAARLLRVPQATLHYWLEGGTRRNKLYLPIIREQATGKRVVTWAEFIEAGLLREYRSRKVPMVELRGFIERLRERLGVPYPLAHFKPFSSGRDLLYEAQEGAHLSSDFALVAEVKNQYLLLPPAQEFCERVTWKDDIATQWRPDEYRDSPVVIDPGIRFGAPTVGGIRTETLWEQAQAGEDERDLAELYDLTPLQVRRAIAYEMATRPAAA
jgi:uncharacterized protein (DUF433 family)